MPNDLLLDSIAFLRDHIAFLGDLLGDHIAFLGDHIAFLGDHIAFLGDHIAFLGDFLGDHIAFLGDHIAFLGDHIAFWGDHIAFLCRSYSILVDFSVFLFCFDRSNSLVDCVVYLIPLIFLSIISDIFRSVILSPDVSFLPPDVTFQAVKCQEVTGQIINKCRVNLWCRRLL
jgi:hypothetical protein